MPAMRYLALITLLSSSCITRVESNTYILPPEPPPVESTPQPAHKPVGTAGCLDEVGCLLTERPPSCCSKYAGASRRNAGTRYAGSTKEALTRADISAGMSRVRGRVNSCGSQYPGKGTVNIKVRVGSDGSVSSAAVKSAPTAALGYCVANAVQKAWFPRSQKGASFTYPFVF